MKEVTKYIFYWFCTFIVTVLTLLLLTALFSSQDILFKVQGNEFPIELKGRVIDIKFHNETHQYIQYRTSGFKNSFQLTHWEGCKHCQEKEKVLKKK